VAITLGLDIGTTSTIGILIDTRGSVLALAQRPVELYSEHAGWAEEDPGQWWANVVAICRELLTSTGLPAQTIAAVGVTGMVPAMVVLDKDGRVLRRSIQQSDGRTGSEVAQLLSEFDPALFLARTGTGINQQLITPKLRWLAAHEPKCFAAIDTLFGSYDYITFCLTGVRSLERNWALEAGFIDLKTGTIAEDLVGLGGIGVEVLPPLNASHVVIGGISAAAAAQTGLYHRTPVIAGVADHVASAFVAGIKEPGDMLLKFGGAGDMLLATRTPRPDPRLFLDYHLVPDLFMPNGCMAASGSVLNWLVRVLTSAQSADRSAVGSLHARLDALAAAVLAGSEGLIMQPYFLGEKTPIHDPAARGTFIGLGLHHQLGHLWRAALEGIAFGFRHHVEVCSDIGYAINRIVASDGGASSSVWMQIVSDVLQRPLQLFTGHPGSCLGAAYAAARGVEAIDSWNAIERFVQPARTIVPNSELATIYNSAFATYLAAYDALKPLYPQLLTN
jgi:xylulokinase